MKYDRFNEYYTDSSYYQKLLKYLKENNNREYLINYEVSDDKFITEEVLYCKNLNHAQELLERDHKKKVFITSFLPTDFKNDEISLFKIDFYNRELSFVTTDEIIANNFIEASQKLVEKGIMPRKQFEVNYLTNLQEIEIYTTSFISIKRFIHVGEVDPNVNLLKFLND